MEDVAVDGDDCEMEVVGVELSLKGDNSLRSSTGGVEQSAPIVISNILIQGR